MVLALSLLVVGVLTRFIPHAPNFTPVIAIALFGGVYLRRSQALWMPLLLMVLSDLALGLHSTIPFTWTSVLLISALGLWMREKATPVRIVSTSLVSAVLFFVITNFGAWLLYYPQTQQGFLNCYTLALPFFRTTLASTLLYTVVLFGTFQLVAGRLQGSRLAPVLLNK